MFISDQFAIAHYSSAAVACCLAAASFFAAARFFAAAFLLAADFFFDFFLVVAFFFAVAFFLASAFFLPRRLRSGASASSFRQVSRSIAAGVSFNSLGILAFLLPSVM